MSMAVLCNNLVPSRCGSRCLLFVDLREHYCQDTAANTSVRFLEEVLGRFQNRRGEPV